MTCYDITDGTHCGDCEDCRLAEARHCVGSEGMSCLEAEHDPLDIDKGRQQCGACRFRDTAGAKGSGFGPITSDDIVSNLGPDGMTAIIRRKNGAPLSDRQEAECLAHDLDLAGRTGHRCSNTACGIIDISGKSIRRGLCDGCEKFRIEEFDCEELRRYLDDIEAAARDHARHETLLPHPVQVEP